MKKKVIADEYIRGEDEEEVKRGARMGKNVIADEYIYIRGVDEEEVKQGARMKKGVKRS